MSAPRVVVETDKFRAVISEREGPRPGDLPPIVTQRLTIERKERDACGDVRWSTVTIYEDLEPAETSRSLFALLLALDARVRNLEFVAKANDWLEARALVAPHQETATEPRQTISLVEFPKKVTP